MTESRYISFTAFQCGNVAEAQVRLTDNHKDGSREELILPVRVGAISDAEDLEDWCRQLFAAAIELI